MKKVIILRGLPASGKSTKAKKLLDANPNSYKRINRDELRAMFDNSYFSKGNEKFVKRVRDLLILEALQSGKHVIVDDTNLSDRNVTRIQQLVHQFNKDNGDSVQVEIQEMKTSLSECIKRDKQRDKRVGEKVIRQMYRRHFDDGKGRYLEQNASLPKAIICDLDGTLALLNGRNPFMASKCENDLLNQPVANVLFNFKKLGYHIILLSGRSDEYKPQTLKWLAQYAIPYDHLFMRPKGDNRKDSIFKTELFDNEVRDKYFVEFILDDRNQVVNMWRDELKLPCFQVYYGDF